MHVLTGLLSTPPHCVGGGARDVDAGSEARGVNEELVLVPVAHKGLLSFGLSDQSRSIQVVSEQRDLSFQLQLRPSKPSTPLVYAGGWFVNWMNTSSRQAKKSSMGMAGFHPVDQFFFIVSLFHGATPRIYA